VGTEISFSRLNIPFERFFLAQEGIFLAFERGVSVFYTGIYLRRVFPWSSNPNLCRVPKAVLKDVLNVVQSVIVWFHSTSHLRFEN
jgi:hypothetical protein